MHGLFSEPRFDWYAVTFKDSVEPDYLVRQALKHWNSSSVELVRPRLPQYQQGIEINLGDRVIFHLCWGGCNSDPHLISKGFSAHEVYEWLIKLDYAYSVSRVDVCTDTVVPNMFDVLTKHQLAFSTARHIHAEPAGEDFLTSGN